MTSWSYGIVGAMASSAGSETPFPRKEVHRYADEAVRVFLAAYAALT